MRCFVLLVLLGLTGCAMTGEQFFVRDAETGESYGPYRFRQGASLSVAQHRYVITRIATTEEITADRMAEIILPAFHFHDTPLSEALDTISKLSVDADPERYRRNRGILIVYAPANRYDPHVTFAAKDISLMEALRVLESISGGYRYYIQEEVVVFGEQPPRK